MEKRDGGWKRLGSCSDNFAGVRVWLGFGARFSPSFFHCFLDKDLGCQQHEGCDYFSLPDFFDDRSVAVQQFLWKRQVVAVCC